MPIGNLTSQIFANIYLNELDQFVKHELKARYYFRYADDFLIVHNSLDYLKGIIGKIKAYLEDELSLQLHPDKVEVRKFRQGIDFLGYVVLPYHTIMRTKTKRRMLKKLEQKKQELEEGLISRESYNQTVQSYLGMLKHCNGYELESRVRKEFLVE